MAEQPPMVESSRPLEALQRQESVHPSLRPGATDVPVTPGIHLSTYASDSSGVVPQSYFANDVDELREPLAQSPSEAAEGAKSGHDILRKMSLSGHQRKASLTDVDPRAANPSLSLSGSVISATFTIPHSLHYRKGQEWVS
jgi:trehalose 6-phosphate synthase/phosphatase